MHLLTDTTHYLSSSLRKVWPPVATQSSYASAKKRFIGFCGEFNIEPLPASESKLCAFASKLAADGLSHETVRCYLSAVRTLHLEYGLDDPGIARMSRLQQTIKGIKSH